MFIRNKKLVSQPVVFSTGTVLFDEFGVANIITDEFAEEVLKIPGFERAEDAQMGGIMIPNPVDENDGEDKIIPTDDEQKSDTNLVGDKIVEPKASEDMTHKQLDALAKELGIEDYPASGDKKEKVAAINQ